MRPCRMWRQGKKMPMHKGFDPKHCQKKRNKFSLAHTDCTKLNWFQKMHKAIKRKDHDKDRYINKH